MSVTKVMPVTPDRGEYRSGAVSIQELLGENKVAISATAVTADTLTVKDSTHTPSVANGTTNFLSGINITTVGAQTQNAITIQLQTGYAGTYPIGMLDSNSANLFLVSATGQIYTTATTIQIGLNSMTWGATSPAAGTWARGDVCWNTGAAGSGSPGWVCSAAGTPGTWKTMANLGA